MCTALFIVILFITLKCGSKLAALCLCLGGDDPKFERQSSNQSHSNLTIPYRRDKAATHKRTISDSDFDLDLDFDPNDMNTPGGPIMADELDDEHKHEAGDEQQRAAQSKLKATPQSKLKATPQSKYTDNSHRASIEEMYDVDRVDESLKFVIRKSTTKSNRGSAEPQDRKFGSWPYADGEQGGGGGGGSSSDDGGRDIHDDDGEKDDETLPSGLTKPSTLQSLVAPTIDASSESMRTMIIRSPSAEDSGIFKRMFSNHEYGRSYGRVLEHQQQQQRQQAQQQRQQLLGGSKEKEKVFTFSLEDRKEVEMEMIVQEQRKKTMPEPGSIYDPNIKDIGFDATCQSAASSRKSQQSMSANPLAQSELYTY